MATTNPFDIAAPSVTTGMKTAAATGVTTPAVATNQYTSSAVFNPAATTTYGTPSPVADGTASPVAQTYDPTAWSVDSDQTVQGQMNNIIAADSPMMQQAKTGALQQMNQRGLINSSMAIGAGQDAVMKNALPIAQQDANMYGRSGEFNAAASNQRDQFNAGSLTDTAKFNSSSALQNSQFNAAQQNTEREANAQRQQESNLAAADTQNKLVVQQLDNAFKATMASADNQTKIQLQQIDATTRESLAETEAEFKQLMQTTQGATDLYQQAIKNINDLVMNPDLDAAAISSGTTNQLNNLKSGMAVLDALNENISGLKDLITFE